MKYMLDTNMCIYAQKNIPQVIEKIKNNFQYGVAISSITLAELEFGVQASANVEKNTIAFPFVQVKVGHRNFVRRAAKARSAVRAGAFAGIWTQIALKIFARGCLNHNYIL